MKSEKKDLIKNEISISDAIKNEISNLNENELCEWIAGPSGLVIIDILNKNVAATKLLEFIFNKYYPNRPILSKYVFKLFPLDITSFSREEDMINLGKEIIERENFNQISKDDCYAINYKNRGNKKLNRDKIIKGIAGFVPKEYKVDLKNPKTVILLQTFGRNAGISILKNDLFAKHKQFNLSNFK